MEKYAFGWKPTEQELKWIREMSTCTKERLLFRVKEQRERMREQSKTDNKHSAAYYSVLDGLFGKLQEGVENLVLFDQLEDCWAYSFYINSEGASVYLDHFSYVTFDKDGNNTSILYNANFELLKIPCRMVTVEEYAKTYEVEQGTVRQWIRRGKIRTAKKYGNEWRISELTEPPKRGYSTGSYAWDDSLTDAPDEYEYLRTPGSLCISQDEKDTKIYHVIVSHGMTIEKSRRLGVREREKLEHFLISHPLIRYIPSEYTTWC